MTLASRGCRGRHRLHSTETQCRTVSNQTWKRPRAFTHCPAPTTGAPVADLPATVPGTRPVVGFQQLPRGWRERAPRRIPSPARMAFSRRHAAKVSAQPRTHRARAPHPVRSVRCPSTVRRRQLPHRPARRAESDVRPATVAGASSRGPALPSPSRFSRASHDLARKGTRKKADPACCNCNPAPGTAPQGGGHSAPGIGWRRTVPAKHHQRTVRSRYELNVRELVGKLLHDGTLPVRME